MSREGTVRNLEAVSFTFMHSGLGYQGCESCFDGVIKPLPFRLVGFKGSVLLILVASEKKP